MERMGDTFREGMAKLTGRGPKGYRRSDDRIREDVCERIARSGLNADDVEVEVENGQVTLSGEVGDRWDKRRLEDVVEDVFGVDEVNNHLRVRRHAAGRGQGTESAQSSSTTGTEGHDGDAGLHH
jgi:osmotically-inducible protein OsmY